jgi:hypothetical protein
MEALKFEKELVDAAAPPGTPKYSHGQSSRIWYASVHVPYQTI